MQKIFMFILLSLILLGCEHDAIVTPPEPRPEGWVSLGLEDKTVNRLVLAGDWLYACAGKDGLYRLKYPQNSGDDWQFLGLGDLDVSQEDFESGVIDVVSYNDTLVAGVWSRKSDSFTPGIFRSFDDGLTWIPSDSGFVKDAIIPSSGIVLRLQQSLSNPRLLVAGCSGDRRQVYISTDLGKTWQLKLSVRGARTFHAIGLHSNLSSEIWAGGRGGIESIPFLYHSSDLGETWQDFSEQIRVSDRAFDNVLDFAFDPNNNQTLYICKLRVVLKTTDYGISWSATDTLQSGLQSLSINPYGSNELIACANDSLYQTFDGGLSWTVLERTPESLETAMNTMAVDWQRRILYVATYNFFSPLHKVYKLYF